MEADRARVAANLMNDGDGALTGPLVRGDAAAIGRNLRALAEDPFRDVYSAFARLYEQRA